MPDIYDFGGGGIGVAPADTPPVPRRPDDLFEFRLGRLLLLLDSLPDLRSAKPLHIERLGYYDFFSDNPFLILEPDDKVRRRLLLAGFSEQSLSYHSASQRFTNRRARLQHDLSFLTARGLVGVDAIGARVTFSLTPFGEAAAAELSTFYAEGLRASAEVVVIKLNRLSDRRLGEMAQQWLKAEPFLVDLYEGGSLNDTD